MTERYNAGDPKQTAERRKDKEDERLRNIHELRGLLRIPEFRKFIWRTIGTTCKWMEEPFNPNGSQQSFNNGVNSVARRLIVEIGEADPTAVPNMMLENHARVASQGEPGAG